MKTITEFSGFTLREAIQKSKDIRDALGTEGRSAEELSTAHQETLQSFLTEKFKLEGERLAHFLRAMEVAQAKPRDLENLKRVVVLGISEGEKIPGTIQVRDSFGFNSEYLASLKPARPQDRRSAGSKHDKGKAKGKKGRGRRRPDLKGKRPDGGPERRGPNTQKAEITQ